jgi:hypothetical protein
MQNVPDGLSVWDSPIWEGWKDAEMRFLLGPIKEGFIPACMNVWPTQALHARSVNELALLAARKSAHRLIRSTDPSFFI